MTTKSNITIDSIVKGVYINNNEVDYIVDINVETEKDISFEYAIINEGEHDDVFIPYTLAKKSLKLQYKNLDGIYRQKKLLLKSNEGKSPASVTITFSNFKELDSTANGEIGHVNLTNYVSGSSYSKMQNATSDNNNTEEEWYKKPVNIAIIILVILIVAMIFFKTNNDEVNYSNIKSSLFLE